MVRRVLIAAASLLLCGAFPASRNAWREAARSKTEPIVFVFLRVDRERDVAILHPMIAPDIGVQLDSGPRGLESGAVLQCEESARVHDAIVEGNVAKVSEMVLECGERTLIVKTVDFRPRGR